MICQAKACKNTGLFHNLMDRTYYDYYDYYDQCNYCQQSLAIHIHTHTLTHAAHTHIHVHMHTHTHMPQAMSSGPAISQVDIRSDHYEPSGMETPV